MLLLTLLLLLVLLLLQLLAQLTYLEAQTLTLTW
jgi:hypothetical protein